MGAVLGKAPKAQAPDFSAQNRRANDAAISAKQDEARRTAELEEAKDAKRKKKGRASLISTSETGAAGEQTG